MQALQNFKTYFFKGLAALLPTALAVCLFVFLQQNVSIPVNSGIVGILVYYNPTYPYITQDELMGYIKDNFMIAADGEQGFAEKMGDVRGKKYYEIKERINIF